jgi:hypothetical protein
MIQFNLLPDVKVAFIKAERQKHLVITIAIISSIVAVSILAFLVVTVRVFQQKNLSDLAKDMKATTSELQDIDDLDKILTVQSQLNTLDSLHDQKPVTSRLYDFITRLTPADASISSVALDFGAKTLEISGKVPTLAIVQKYADTLKFTTYRPAEKLSDDTSPDPAVFADVVLSTFSRQKEGADYTLKMSFDAEVFSGTKQTTVNVPNIVSTDTVHDRPTSLFQSATQAEAQ